MAAKIGLSQIVENLESFWLQRVGGLQFKLGLAILFDRCQEHAESEVQPDIVFILRGKCSRQCQTRSSLSRLEVAADKVEPSLHVGWADSLKVRNGFCWQPFGH